MTSRSRESRILIQRLLDHVATPRGNVIRLAYFEEADIVVVVQQEVNETTEAFVRRFSGWTAHDGWIIAWALLLRLVRMADIGGSRIRFLPGVDA